MPRTIAFANFACDLAKQSDVRYMYFTNRNIKPSWTKGLGLHATKHFNFYEVNMKR